VAVASNSLELFGSSFAIFKFAIYISTFALTILGMVIMAGKVAMEQGMKEK